MTVEAFFSQTYDEARGKFLAAAQTRRLRIERHLHPDVVGPSGEQLSIDTALLAPAQAQACVGGGFPGADEAASRSPAARPGDGAPPPTGAATAASGGGDRGRAFGGSFHAPSLHFQSGRTRFRRTRSGTPA